MQHLRELSKNSIEAGASIIQCKEEPKHLELGIKKLMFADNGEGMTPNQMFEYLCKYNSSSKDSDSGYHSNYGIGVKATTAHFNPYGVVYLSWHPDHPDGHMVWLAKEGGSYGLKTLSYYESFEDDDDEEQEPTLQTLKKEVMSKEENEREQKVQANVFCLKEFKEIYEAESFEGSGEDYGLVKWWECKPSFIKDHGLVVILLGGSAKGDSFTTSQGVPLTGRKITGYFNLRYYRLPPDVRFRVPGHTTTPKGFVGAIKAIHETPLGFVEFAWSGVCPHNGFNVALIVTKSTKELREVDENNLSVYNQFDKKSFEGGFVALEYKGELYNHTYGGGNLRKWGVATEALWPKVKIIVSPPLCEVIDEKVVKEGVFPTDGRGRLLWEGGEEGEGVKEVSLVKTQNWFHDVMPQELIDLMDSAYVVPKSRSRKYSDQFKKYEKIFRSQSISSTVVKRNYKEGETPYIIDNFSGEVEERPSSTETHIRPPSSVAGKPVHKRPSLTGKEDPKGKRKGVIIKKGRKRRRDPHFEWVGYEEGGGEFGNIFKDKYVYPIHADLINDTFEVKFNKEHRDFVDAKKYFCHQYKLTPKMEEEVVNIIQEEYESHVAAFLFHTLGRVESDKALRNADIERNSLWSPQALMSRVSGAPYDIYPMIKQRVTRKFKKLSPKDS
jgi:hypothetical protein